MIDDTLKQYGISRKTGEAVLATLETIAQRGDKLPSSDVIDRAMTVLGKSPSDNDGISSGRPAQVYEIRSATEDRTHLVALYLDDIESGPVTDGKCSCKATTYCHHLLYALTMAEHDGYHLTTDREEKA